MIKNLDNFEQVLESKKQDGVLFYFSTRQCHVCKVLKPKIYDMLQKHYPKIEMHYIDTEKIPEAGGHFSVFAAPTIILFLDGKEFIRQSRNIGVMELASHIERPYSLFFD
ncbi:thioredoxin family protein [bacterium]|nr:thioredoxin family protein [bacterium]